MDAGLMKPRTFIRRIAAISSLYRCASEPSRSAVTGVPWNPIASAFIDDSRKEHPWLVRRTIRPASRCNLQRFARDRNAKRDYVLIKGSYLLGCRVSEMAAIRWKHIEPIDGGGQIHLIGKGSKSRAVRISSDSLALFEQLGRGEASGFVLFKPQNRRAPHKASHRRCLPQMGQSRRVPRSPTPAEV